LFDIANPNRDLMTQMTAQVFFIIADASDTLLVPMAALQLLPGKPVRQNSVGKGKRKATVQVLAADGKTEIREVEVGVSDRIQAQILSGLQEGERVLLGVASGNSRKAQGGGSRPPRLH
jgi:macrolide-specific efflux system membrane fusion protein